MEIKWDKAIGPVSVLMIRKYYVVEVVVITIKIERVILVLVKAV